MGFDALLLDQITKRDRLFFGGKCVKLQRIQVLSIVPYFSLATPLPNPVPFQTIQASDNQFLYILEAKLTQLQAPIAGGTTAQLQLGDNQGIHEFNSSGIVGIPTSIAHGVGIRGGIKYIAYGNGASGDSLFEMLYAIATFG